MGAEVPVAQYFVLPLAIQMLKDIAGRISSICGSVPVCQQEGQNCIVYKEPYGLTLGIVPWNAPYVFGIRSAATAIATGNTVVLKASELTPRCYWAIGKAFHEAGLSKGALNIISCPPSKAAEIVETMIQHPAVRKINFTGSAAVGRIVARKCGQHLKSFLMELGGKNSAIVLDDANIPKAAGQICMGTDRIILHSAIETKFLETLKESLVKEASGTSPPPSIVSINSKMRLQKLVFESIEKGASNIMRHDPKEAIPSSRFIPTVLGSVNSSSELWTEECFGPVVAYTVVNSEEEAITIANGTAYGLSAAIFTRDLRKGLAIAKRLESGAVHINSMTIHDEPNLPFGGVKSSGWGMFNADMGMEEFLVTKSVT